MAAVAIPHGGGRGLGILLHWLLHLVAWRVVFHALRGFLSQYTHVPWLGAVIVAAIVVALLRFAFRTRRRRYQRSL